jgi:predicted kinase
MAVLAFCGISGSGKSRLAQQFTEEGYPCICPDTIRRELTGDISDQSQNHRVFEIAYKRLSEHLAFEVESNIVFDATNLSERSLKSLRKAIPRDVELIVYIMMDSSNAELCKRRVMLDIDKGVDRAKVPCNVINQQHMRWHELMQHLPEEGFTYVEYLSSI